MEFGLFNSREDDEHNDVGFVGITKIFAMSDDCFIRHKHSTQYSKI